MTREGIKNKARDSKPAQFHPDLLNLIKAGAEPLVPRALRAICINRAAILARCEIVRLLTESRGDKLSR